MMATAPKDQSTLVAIAAVAALGAVGLAVQYAAQQWSAGAIARRSRRASGASQDEADARAAARHQEANAEAEASARKAETERLRCDVERQALDANDAIAERCDDAYDAVMVVELAGLDRKAIEARVRAATSCQNRSRRAH